MATFFRPKFIYLSILGFILLLLATLTQSPASAANFIFGTEGSLTDPASIGLFSNTPPTAVDDSENIDEDSTLMIDLVGNDLDAEGDALTISAIGTVANGTMTFDSATTVTYTPTLNFNGTETLTYTVSDGNLTDSGNITITVDAINDAPVGVDDIAYTVNEDTSLNVMASGVLANDSDVENDALTASLETDVSNGTLTFNSNGSFDYTPNLNFNGVDAFTYVPNDGNLDGEFAVVTITVNAVNDAPIAFDDVDITDEDAPITIDLSANDTDIEADSLSIIAIAGASNGTATIASTSSIFYTPTLNFNGVEQLNYTLSDGNLTATALVTITVIPVDDPVIAVSDSITITEDGGAVVLDLFANDIDPDNDPLIISEISYAQNGDTGVFSQTLASYNPFPDFYGTDTFTYTVDDGQGNQSSATVTVTVLNTNDDPNAVDDSVTVQTNDVATLDVLANDDLGSDVGESAVIINITQASHGAVAITNGGMNLSYTSDSGYIGLDQFTYTISDGNGGSDTATVQVNVVSTVPEVELTIDSVAAYPSTVCKGGYFGLLFELNNLGTVAAGAHNVHIFDDDSALGYQNQIGTAPVNGPEAEQSSYFSASSNSFIVGTRYIKVLADGDNAISESLEDNNGNYTTITVQPDDAPSGTILINNGDVYATDLALGLVLSADDLGQCATHVAKMRFAHNGTITVWEPYTTTKTLNLADASGDTSVAVQYLDANNNLSPFIRESIIVDAAPPASKVIAPGNRILTSTVDVVWSGADSVSGIQAYDIQYNQDGTGWVDWQLGITTTSAILTNAAFDNTYCFRSRARDLAGNQEPYPNGDGDTCVAVAAPPAGIDVYVQNLQLTQAIQTPSNAVPLVENKSTAVQLTIGRGTDNTPIASLAANVHVFRNGVELNGSPLTAQTSLPQTPNPDPHHNHQLLHVALPSEWLNGTIELVVVLDPNNAIAEGDETNNRYPATGRQTATFSVVPDLEITIVPIIWEKGGQRLTLASADLLSHFDYLQKVYPTADVKIEVHSSYVYSAETVNWLDLLSQIDTLRATELPAASVYQKYVGLLPTPNTPINGLLGLAYQPGSTAVGYAHQGSGITIAHELAHTLGLRDVASSATGCRQPFLPNNQYPYANGITAYPGWDYKNTAVVPSLAHDLMAYCEGSWVSDFTYQALFNVLTEENAPIGRTSATHSSPMFASTTWMDTVAAFRGSQRIFPRAATTSGSLLVSGWIAGNGSAGEITSAFTFTETTTVNMNESGNFRLVLFDQHGFMTDVRYFDVPTISDPSVVTAHQPYAFLFTKPPKLGAIRLYYGGTLLAETVPSTTPAVEITAPIPSTMPTDSFALTWDGVIGQRYVVRFSADSGNTWTLLTPPITTTTYTLDLTTVAGTTAGLLEVVASNSLHSAISRSQPFTVTTKAPQVAIYAPATAQRFGPTEIITLSGNAFDFEDGSFTDAQLTWISNRDGVLGNGQTLATRDLSPGIHTITLQVTDSNGQIGMQQIVVIIPAIYLPIVFN
ncbi:MAG: cadherin-like domain-containing protein [Candidatus Promineifilaceae bacterium]